MPNQVQPIRREFKFEVTEGLASEIKRYLGTSLQRDAQCGAGGELGYQVCSVYVDSSNAILCGQTLKGHRNRFKLRVRIYDDNPEHPAFVEIKRRDGHVVKKQRAMVDRQAATQILAGERRAYLPLAEGSFGNANPFRKEWLALNEFRRLQDAIGGIGTTYVSYVRDAYVSPDGMEWRATFDRSLKASPYRIGERISIPSDGLPVMKDRMVVFELKFTNRFPRWMEDLVRIFDLSAVSYPKYVNCVEALQGGVRSASSRGRQSLDASAQRVG